MRKVWTEDEVRILTEMYPDHFVDEICKVLQRSKNSVYCKAGLLGLKVPREKMQRAGRMSSNHPNVIAAQFPKGHVPANKGRKMSPELYAKCAPTMFKKGHRNDSQREVGAERINEEGYIEIKVADPNVWRLKQRYLWEKSYGPIPRGCIIQFIDGDRQNCHLDNLRMITRAGQMKYQNSLIARYPKELQDTIRYLGALKRRIRKEIKDGSKEYEP